MYHRDTQFLTEDALYDFMLEAKTDKCKSFRKWVTKEVLPSIRKTGGYVKEEREEDFINNNFSSFSETIKLGMIKELMAKNNKLEVKADYCDKVLNPVDNETFLKLVTMTDVAKDMSMSAMKLNKIMNYNKIIFKQGKSWKLYGKYDDLLPEYFDYTITEYGQSLKCTEKGRKFILDNIVEWKNKFEMKEL